MKIINKCILFISTLPRRIRNNYWKKRFKACGENLQILGRVFTDKPQNVSIGNNVNLNEGVRLLCSGNSVIEIGDNVTLSPGVSIISTGYDLNVWKNDSKKRAHICEKVVIGDDVWICTNATVLPGVTISGQHVVLGSGGVLTQDIVLNDCIYAGVPAKMIKKLP